MKNFQGSFGTITCIKQIHLNREKSLPYSELINSEKIGKIKCIPTKYGMKSPFQLYDAREKELLKMVTAIGKKDIATPDVEIPSNYMIGLKGRLSFEDCLEYLKKILLHIGRKYIHG